MTWLEAVKKSISYIEEHLTDELTIEQIANEVYISPFYFQKGFAILCEITVSEYIRNRRLSLAGRDLRIDGSKVIDIAMKYGYDSPDSFAKAFTRFHGITPVQAKNGEGELKNFLPLKVQISMKGGFEMDCKIIKKPAFTIVGSSKMFGENEGFTECPKMWDDHFASGDGKYIAGMYGFCLDDMGDKTIMELTKDKQSKDKLPKFMYMIADDYVPSKTYPEKFITYEVPANTWAVFPCKGPMPSSMQGVYQKIFKEWLPENTDYELAGMYNIEYYTDSSKYEKGNQDEEYYSELWFSVKAR